jgi:hypothetical protein
MGRVKEAVFSWPPSINQVPCNLTKEQVGAQVLCNEFSSNQLPAGYTMTSSEINSLNQVARAQSSQNSTSSQQNNSFPLTPLSNGGYIFNYPPQYSNCPYPPFSRPKTVTSQNSSNISSTILLSPESPLSDSQSSPASPCSSPQYSFGFNSTGCNLRREKLEKYRQKRIKRNWNRPVDQARRERAQSRPRDELGHFLSTTKRSENPQKVLLAMDDVRNQLEVWMKESQELQSKLSVVEQQLQEQQKLNTQLLHENRILWSTIPTNDVFNTIRPGTPYVEAFKEKVDLSNIELNFTDSPFLESTKLDEDSESRWSLDIASLDLISGSLS